MVTCFAANLIMLHSLGTEVVNTRDTKVVQGHVEVVVVFWGRVIGYCVVSGKSQCRR